MRRQYLLILFFLTSICSFGQIFNGDLILTTQSEIDNFHYTNVTGNLTIQEAYPGAILDTSPLTIMRRLGGNLTINKNTTIIDISGFSGLYTINGYLDIRNNAKLKNLSGLRFINTIKDDIKIVSNDKLTNIHGLSRIDTVQGSIHIQNNTSLRKLFGLRNLTTVTGSVFIKNNNDLVNLDYLDRIRTIGNRLTVTGNTNLIQGCGIVELLENTGSIGGIVNIHTNGNSTSSQQQIIDTCALTGTNLIYIGDLTLSSQAEIDAFNYNIITGNLTIRENQQGAINSIEKLISLKRVEGNLEIVTNSSLSSINGLDNLVQIGGDLILDSNDLNNNEFFGTTYSSLIISHFHCINVVEKIFLRDTVAEELIVFLDSIDGLCRGKDTPFKRRDTSRSGSVSTFRNKEVTKNIFLYPTISNGHQIIISGLSTDFSYLVYDVTGQLVEQKSISSSSQNTTIRFKKQLMSGMYFIKIQGEKRINTLRFLVK